MAQLGRTHLFGRMHFRTYRSKKVNSILYQHAVERHGRKLRTLGVRILSSIRGDSATRQIFEAAAITKMKPYLGSKHDWCSNSIYGC